MGKHTAVVSVMAQEDNLGDIEIRAVLLDWITSSDIEVLGYRGSMSDSYMEPFQAYRAIDWQRSHARLQASTLGAVLRGHRVHFFLAPGPQIFSSRPGDVAKCYLNLCNAGLANASGGGSHIVGRAFRGSGSSKAPSVMLARRAATLAVRDAMSRQNLDGLGEVCPDLAFYPERWSNQTRKYVVFCVRETAGLHERSLDAAISASRRLQFEPVFLVQVKRDNAYARRVAERLEIEYLLWDDADTHRAQLTAIEGIYAQAAFVVSNRLHGLILGARAGAIPVPIPAAEDTKLQQTLGTCISENRAVSLTNLDDKTEAQWCALFEGGRADAATARLRTDIEAARIILARLRGTLLSRLSG